MGDYTFVVTHYDGHDSHDSKTFDVHITNDITVFTEDPTNWNILEDHEDATTLPYGGTSDSSTYDGSHVTTNDEGYGLTYTLYMDGVDWATMTDHKPNGADGGVVEFDTATGQIHWLTTNADVTVGQDGIQITAPYHFTVVADDGHTATSDLPSETFEVTVSNWQPDITRYPTAPTELQATEDATYMYTDGPSTETGVESNDEGVEGDHWAADRYTLLRSAGECGWHVHHL